MHSDSQATAVRMNCFDASALVKLYVDEPRSDILRKYFYSESSKYTTPFCFFETLSILKGRKNREQLSEDGYFRATFELVAWFGSFSEKLPDVKLTSSNGLKHTQEIANRYSLDLSDAFQILSVKDGYFSAMCDGSKTILVTADEKLAAAARSENLRVWDILNEPPPTA